MTTNDAITMVTGLFLSVGTHGGSRRSLVSYQVCWIFFTHTTCDLGPLHSICEKIYTTIIINHFVYQDEGVGVRSRF